MFNFHRKRINFVHLISASFSFQQYKLYFITSDVKTKMLADENCVGMQNDRIFIFECMENHLANIPSTYQSNGWISKSNANDQNHEQRQNEWESEKRKRKKRQEDRSRARVYANKLFAYFRSLLLQSIRVYSPQIRCVYFADISNIYQKFYLLLCRQRDLCIF